MTQTSSLALGNLNDNSQQGKEDDLTAHKRFEGNRPSIVLLFKDFSAYTIGQLFSIYENRVVTEGFLNDVNSFDQFGVELGKQIAKGIKAKFETENPMEALKKFGEGEPSLQNIVEFFVESYKQ